MKSVRPGKPLDLDSDLPTTKDDVEALRRLRQTPRLTFEEYLRFLAQFEQPPTEDLRKRRGPRGDRPFELP